MGKNKDKALELSYTVEALDDEIEYLKNTIAELERKGAEDHARIWELICHNDRLTLSYEPYRPPGDEHEGLTFYGLVEENKELIKLNKYLETRVSSLLESLTTPAPNPAPIIPVAPKKPLIKYDRYWNATFELWPGAWGLNYYRYQGKKYNSESREGNIQIGPFGFNWNRDPKRSY